jgi:hypothetical protein
MHQTKIVILTPALPLFQPPKQMSAGTVAVPRDAELKYIMLFSSP